MIEMSALRARHLCACLTAAFGIVAGHAHAAVPIVLDDCGDADTAGSLRNTIATAANDAIIDVSQCSTITLTQGELALPISVTIQGAPGATTTIDANFQSRAFSYKFSSPFDSLTLDSVTVTHGRNIQTMMQADGGCIFAGTLSLKNSLVTDCIAQSDLSEAKGGGVLARTTTLQNSRVENSSANGAGARGGGVYSLLAFNCTSSSVSGNQANETIYSASGAGVSTPGSVSLVGCTIDSNASNGDAGGIVNYTFTAGHTFEISNSTISGNSAHRFGAIQTNQSLTMNNSTVAYNSAPLCGGIYSSAVVGMNSSIVAKNAGGDPNCGDLVGSSIAGAANLVEVVNTAVPIDTIVANPLLTPLAYRGGPTRTHGLLPGSPAVDAGSNGGMLDNDQRGAGFAREVGLHADIGAFERQADDDELFYNGFE